MANRSEQQPNRGCPFQKGKSGNPGGPPKMDPNLRELAQSYTVEAINGLAAIARSKGSPAAARVSAWTAVLDRAWGKPLRVTHVEISADQVTALIHGGFLADDRQNDMAAIGAAVQAVLARALEAMLVLGGGSRKQSG